MDKIKLKIAIILATITFSGNAFAQTSTKDLIGLPIDSVGFSITMDSTTLRTFLKRPNYNKRQAEYQEMNFTHTFLPLIPLIKLMM